MRERDLDDKLNKAFDALSSISRVAYQDIFLLSNQVLSKNPFASRFVSYYLRGNEIPEFSLWTIFHKVLKYYISSIFHFTRYLIQYIVYQYKGIPQDTKKHRSDLTIIDTFFLCDRISRSGDFKESYFQGFDEVLRDLGINYTYLPVYHNCRNIHIYNRVHEILKRDRIPLLSEFELLRMSDLWRIFLFIIVYPWRVWFFVAKADTSDKTEVMILREMIHTLDQVTFRSHSRYCQGKRISELPFDRIKVISWFENQVIDKCLYKGLRANAGKVFIYGAQLFLYSKLDLNIIVDEQEKGLGILPDRVVVNGPSFIPNKPSSFDYIIGPSLRYREQFRTTGKMAGRNILVLLSYSQEDTENVLQVLAASELSSQKLIIKPHPATSEEEIKRYLRNHWILAEENLYALLKNARLVIGSATGSLLESASMGIPVIRIKNHHGFDYAILPELGRGCLWDEVDNPAELDNLAEKYIRMSDDEILKMAEIAAIYKNDYFCEPTKRQIIESFDLLVERT